MCQERTYRGGDIRRTWKDKQEFEWQGGRSGSWCDGEDVSGEEMADQKAKRRKIKKAKRNKRSQVNKKDHGSSGKAPETDMSGNALTEPIL